MAKKWSYQLLASSLVACSLNAIPSVSYGQDAAATEQKPAGGDSATQDSPGQAELDEATDLKLEADSVEKLNKVIELCQKAIEKGLEDGDKTLAQQLLSSSAFDKAQLIVQRMQQGQLTPRSVQRQRDEAIKAIDLALENDSKLADAWLLKAKLYTLPQPNVEKAIEAASKAIDLLNDKPNEQAEALLLRARLHKDDPEATLADLKKATEVDPSNTNAWQLRIGLLESLGKNDEAFETSSKLLEREPENLVALDVSIRSLVRSKRTNDAIALLSKRIEAAPENAVLYRLRGQLKRSLEKDDEALTDLDKAIQIDSQDALALMMRGEIYLDKNEVEKARKDIDEALSIEPNLVQGILMRSLVAAREKRYNDAITDMRKLVRNQPDNPLWMLQLASYYQLDDRPRMAIKVIDEVLKLDDKNWRALRLRGDSHLSIGEHAEAIVDFEKAVKVLDELEKALPEGTELSDGEKDDIAGVLNNLAWVLATSPKDEVRNGKRALELGLKACELTKYKEAHILSTLAAGYAESGDMEKAKEWSKKAVELGEQGQAEQLEQLKLELKSYEEGKAWREKQDQEENDKPVANTDKGIDT